MERRHLLVPGLALIVLGGNAAVLAAQQLSQPVPFASAQWDVAVLRPTGQPVIPIFEGWYKNPDSSYNLCFGFINLNTEQVIEIPLGPDNFLEPREFDGVQPTHFPPKPPNDTRYYCAFTVKVPQDVGEQRVTWTLRYGGQVYKVPGHITHPNYMLDELEAAPRGDMETQELDGTSAPAVHLVSPAAGPHIRGRGGLEMGTVNATVRQPLTLTTEVIREGGDAEDRRPAHVWWMKHQGPAGEVAFAGSITRVEMDTQGTGRATTTAVFTEPGEYVLRVKAYNGANEFQYHCCWTNGFLRVRVGR